MLIVKVLECNIATLHHNDTITFVQLLLDLTVPISTKFRDAIKLKLSSN